MPIQNLTQEEIAALEAVESGEAWDNEVDKVKDARGGAYPPDWWATMKLSGRMDQIFAKFGETTELKIISVPRS